MGCTLPPPSTENLISHKTVMHPTTASRTTAIALACLLAAGGIGMWLRPFLPEYDCSVASRPAKQRRNRRPGPSSI
jgi:hypothetical protein